VSARTLRSVHDGCCAVARTAEIIARKWTALIVHDLSKGPRRFSELERACGISPGTLIERLHFLERHGVVVRRAYSECPPRVEYELTEKGEGLLPIIAEMSRFGHCWLVRDPSTGAFTWGAGGVGRVATR
jgi:DNA-binding HxlR family transcriptional regulator